jgi:Ca2+-binding RTX toxin-like protein
VFWSHSSGRFEVWKVGASGNYESTVTAHLWQHEKTFKVDLNGDGIDSGNNNIYGSIGNDTFDGGAGDDIINGREGHDTLIGGEGNDWISGDGGSGYAGNDILFGNAGNDDLRGRDGNDQIDGGTGSDIIRTGSGSDKIILRIGDGGNTLADADIITDFTDGSDKLRLDGGLLFSQLVIDQGSGAYASDTIISKGTEYLAILQGIDIIQLSDADFETVDIA